MRKNEEEYSSGVQVKTQGKKNGDGDEECTRRFCRP